MLERLGEHGYALYVLVKVQCVSVSLKEVNHNPRLPCIARAWNTTQDSEETVKASLAIR